MLPWRSRLPDGARAEPVGSVRHSIMDRRYRCTVLETDRRPEDLPGEPAGPGRWVDPSRLEELLHSSLVTKAIRIAEQTD
jgi:hypothetical protein